MALSPMMQQYFTVKDQVPDALLFFRVGDFYEMFFEDALTASKALELTLTGKDCGLEERAPMCGVPFHAVDTYVTRLVEDGYKVAICEQMEDPALAKGLVKRDVIRVVTPGTLTTFSAAGERRNHYLLSVCVDMKRAGLAWCDLSTGEFYVQQCASDEKALGPLVGSVAPGEVIANDASAVSPVSPVRCQKYTDAAFSYAGAKERVLTHFGVGTLLALGLGREHREAVRAAGALLHYLSSTQKNGLEHITGLKICREGDYMALDPATRRNLELTESLRDRSSRGTLLQVLDHTVTAMGARQLRAWVEKPLMKKDAIEERLSAVEAFVSSPMEARAVRESLEKVYDMERLLTKVSYHSLNARDCLALCRSLKEAPAVKALLSGMGGEALKPLTEKIDPCAELTELLEKAVDPDAPVLLTEGGLIREGYSPELDEMRQMSRNGVKYLSDLEAREREETGIKNLRVQYNKVFGYYIEVTKSNYSLVPERYRRRQTLTNAERFTTPELEELENRLTHNRERSLRLETELFDGVRAEVARHLNRLKATAEAYKALDALLSLSTCAVQRGYVRPRINEEGTLTILNGRHPVVEANMPAGEFVPNDTQMDLEDRRMHIITGPNMAGKSTYMRQVALITLLAHMGSFVPADEADISLVDCVYTRVGASDDVASGQSTFMVEMSEMAYILRNATEKSLVILDEIGRGTSTFDGLSIAWSAVEYLCDKKKCGAKTLFATHYHELSELQGHLEGVVNYCVAVKEMGEEVLFLRKIWPGGADKSFGIYVARLAGVPGSVVARAQQIEKRLEVQNSDQNSLGQNILTAEKAKQRQVDLMHVPETEFIEEIRAMDVLAMTPMDALNALFLIREKALKL